MWSVALSDRTGSNGHKLKLKKFHLNIRLYSSFTVTMTECRHRVPKEAVEIFRNQPDTALRDLLQPSLL